MPIVHVPVQLTIEHLMAAVKQLSRDELCEFAEQFAAWQKQHDQRDEEEAALLAVVEEYSRLPTPEQRRYERLRRKCERRTLPEDQLAEYQALSNRSRRATSSASKRLSPLRSDVVRPCEAS